MRDNLFLTGANRMAILKRECNLLSAQFLSETEPAGGGTENVDKVGSASSDDLRPPHA